LGIFDRDYAKKTAGSNEEHRYPDRDGFAVDTPMGRQTGVKEMVEMSKTLSEYQYPLTPSGSWQPSGFRLAPSPATSRWRKALAIK